MIVYWIGKALTSLYIFPESNALAYPAKLKITFTKSFFLIQLRFQKKKLKDWLFAAELLNPIGMGVGWGVTTLIGAAPTGVHLVGGGAGPVGRGINPRGHEHMEFLAATAKTFHLD